MKEEKLSTPDSFSRSNLIQMLKTFSKEEMKEFDKFVRSPFFNNRNDVIRLFKELKKFHPLFEGKNFTKEKIYSTLFPDEKYKDDVMRRLGSKLKVLIENYLSNQYFSEDAFQRKYGLIYSLYVRKLDKVLFKELRNCEDILESNNGVDELYLLKSYQLSEIKRIISYNRGKVKFILNDTEEVDKLIYFFLYKLFVNLSEMKTEEREYNTKYNFSLHSAFLNSFSIIKLFDEITNNKIHCNALVLAYYYAYMASLNYKDESFRLKLEVLLKSHSDKFTRNISRDLYFRLLNVYTYITRLGNSNYFFYKERFEIYKILISKNLLFQPQAEYLDVVHIINLTFLCKELKELDWIESFLEENINNILPEEQNNIFNFTKAFIAFERKEFGIALSFIMKVNFNVRKYYSKILLCKIYYEMNYTEQLLSFIDSYRHFLNNDKSVPKDFKITDLFFLKYLNKLIIIKCKNNYKALPSFLKNIPKEKFSNKDWLLEKIEELKNIKK